MYIPQLFFFGPRNLQLDFCWEKIKRNSNNLTANVDPTRPSVREHRCLVPSCSKHSLLVCAKSHLKIYPDEWPRICARQHGILTKRVNRNNQKNASNNTSSTGLPGQSFEQAIVIFGRATHLKNMLVKLDHLFRDRGENKNHLKPPPSTVWLVSRNLDLMQSTVQELVWEKILSCFSINASPGT